MKTWIERLICAALLAFALPCHSQLVLKQGETWTWQFDSLVRTGSVSTFVSHPNGSLTLTLNSSTFQNGEMLRYEMFENSPSEPPLCSGTLTTASPSTALLCETADAWQALQ